MYVNIEQNGTVESSEENLVPSYSYVLHGAQAYCACGSRPARLTIPTCHGTYMHDMPIMTIEDSETQVNVKAFGFCTALDNPDRLEIVKGVMDIVEGKSNLLDKIMDGLSGKKRTVKSLKSAVDSTFGYGEDSTKDPYNGYSPDVYENVTVPCKPMFAIGDVWMDSSDRLKINGVNALTSQCWLRCIKAKEGKIQLADDGQENATSEQHGAVDMASWEKGDPIPDPTQGNLERLDQSIEDLENRLLKPQTPEEYKRIQAELKNKTELREQMGSTLTMMNEIQTGLMLGAYGEDYESAINDMNTIKEAFKSGTPCVTISEEDQNEWLNGAYQTCVDGGDVSAYLEGKTSPIPYDNFNGTAINSENANDVEYIFFNGRLMSRTEYNQSISEYVNKAVNSENG